MNGLDERGRFLYTQADKVDQQMEWLMNHAVVQTERMDRVIEQTTKTNGTVAQAKADIIALKDTIEAQQKATAPVVKAYGIGSRVAKSKYAWAAVVVFFVVGVPFIVAHAPDPLAFLKAAWTIVVGS